MSKSLKISQAKAFAIKHGFELKSEEKPKSTGIVLTPSLREMFKSEAKRNGMSMSEYMRRATLAAVHDPSLLSRPEVEEAEAAYQENLGSSRWKKDLG